MMLRGQIKAGVRDELIAGCAALVTHIVAKERQKLIAEGYGNHASFAFDDLQAEGCIGLCKAADAYDPNMNNKFSTYAYHRIEGHIKDFVRKEKKQLMAKRNALSEPVNDADDFTDRIAASVDFAEGFKQLSEDEQKLLLTYAECGSSIDEAAVLLNIPVSAAEDILLRGRGKLKMAIEETDRVWQDITWDGVLYFILMKYWPADPEEALKKFRENILLKKSELTEKPYDFYWFEEKNEMFEVIVDPIKERISVIENNFPED